MTRPLSVAILLVLAMHVVHAQARVDFSAAAAAAERQASAATIGSANTAPEYLQARLAYDKFALQHARRTYIWQFWSGIVVFAVVMTTVIVGLWLSFLHFYEGRRGGSHIKMSATGVEVSSPVIGLLILIVSLGFFYLYLSQVYPITEVKP
jgi:hypothetical protein